MSYTRVTQNSSAWLTLSSLQKNLRDMQKTQIQLSDGRVVQAASDDPAATAAAMQQTSRKSAGNQYLKNVEYASSRLGITDNTLSGLVTGMQSIRNLMVQAQNGSMTDAALVALGDQITELQTEMVDLYNTTYLGHQLFGGTAAPGDVVAGSPGSYTYTGDDQPVYSRISKTATVDVSVAGRDIGADTVPDLLTQAAAHVSAGDSAGIATDLDSLDAALDGIVAALGDVGARVNRVTNTKHLVQAQVDDATSQISNSLDLDTAEAVVRLQQQQNSYQAALAVTSRVLTKSLVDYLA